LVTLGLDITTFSGQLNVANASLTTFGGNVGKVFKEVERKVLDSIRNIGIGMVALSGAAGLGLKNFVGVAADFEQELSKVKAVSGATADEMELLKEQAIEAGESTVYTSGEAAKAQGELIKSGLSLKQVLSGGLEGALQLAAAGEIDLASAAEIASTALNTFRKDNLTVIQAADILAGASNASATDVEGLRLSLSMVGTVADGAGMKFKDTATALAVFAQNGLKGSDAGTSFKTMIMNLIPKTKEQIETMSKLGLITEKGTSAFYDQSGDLRDLASIAEMVKIALKGLTNEQRSSYLESMFGTDAIRAGNILYKEGAAGVSKMAAEMSKTTAAQVAKDKTDNLRGSIIQLSGAFESLKLAIGDPLIKPIQIVTNFLKLLTNSFNALPSFIKSTISYLFGIGIVVNFILGAFLMLFVTMAKLSFWFLVLRLGGFKLIGMFLRFTVGYIAAKAINVLAMAFNALKAAMITNPIIAAMVLIIGLLAFLAYQSGYASKWIDQLIKKLRELGVLAPAVAGSAAADGTDDYTDSISDLNDMINDYKDSAKDAEKSTKKFLAAFDEVYQIPEDDELPKIPEITPPNETGGGGGDSLGGGTGGSDYTPELDWPPIPPFPGWPPIPPIPIPQVQPVVIPVLQPEPVIIPVLVPEPVPVPSWVYAFAEAFQLAFAPVLVLAEAFQLAWQTCTQLVTSAVVALQTAWVIVWEAIAVAVQPVKELATIFSLAWQAATDLVKSAVVLLQQSWDSAWAGLVAAVKPVIELAKLFGDAWNTGYDKIKEVMKDFGDWASDKMGQLGDMMKQPLSQAFAVMESFWEDHKTAVLVTVGLLIVGIVAWWLGLPALVLEAIALLLPRLAAFLPRVAAAFTGLIDDVLAYFEGMPGRIISALASLPGKLYDLGVNAWNSFKSAFPGVVRLIFSSGGNTSTVPAYASGTDYHPGGWAVVGEKGPEILNLPRGSSVTPNSDIESMVGTSSAGKGGSSNIGIDYERIETAFINALQSMNVIAKVDTSTSSMTSLVRAMQPAIASEKARRGGS